MSLAVNVISIGLSGWVGWSEVGGRRWLWGGMRSGGACVRWSRWVGGSGMGGLGFACVLGGEGRCARHAKLSRLWGLGSGGVGWGTLTRDVGMFKFRQATTVC